VNVVIMEQQFDRADLWYISMHSMACSSDSVAELSLGTAVEFHLASSTIAGIPEGCSHILLEGSPHRTFGADDYLAACQGGESRLSGGRVEAGWDPRLAATMFDRGLAVHPPVPM
jgi:hypothetical protein